MTLREIISRNPDLFYSQQWYSGEPFMDREAVPFVPVPQSVSPAYTADAATELPYASTLARLYVDNPDLPMWNDYIWCADVDSKGQRVYIGGKSNTGKLEIHRHIHITDRFKVVSWAA